MENVIVVMKSKILKEAFKLLLNFKFNIIVNMIKIYFMLETEVLSKLNTSLS